MIVDKSILYLRKSVDFSVFNRFSSIFVTAGDHGYLKKFKNPFIFLEWNCMRCILFSFFCVLHFIICVLH